jgi:4'-phosphopantetheinyl transferase
VTGSISLYWLTQTTADLVKGNDWLSERERAVLDEKRILKRRTDWRLGRWTAKHALAAFGPDPGKNISDFEIFAADDGAPEVFADGRKAAVAISISHSEGVGLCVLTGDAEVVGCDLEKINERSPSFLADYFTAVELSGVMECPADERALASTLIWCAKESALKTLREGLRRDTRSVEVAVDLQSARDGWNPFSVTCMLTSKVFDGWWRREGDFVLAVTTGGTASEPVELILA